MPVTNRRKAICAISIILVSLAYIFYKRSSEADSRKIVYRSREIKKLPRFAEIDFFGRSINNETFKRSNLYLQFVNGKSDYEIDFLKQVYSNWKEYDLCFLFIVNDFNLLKKKIKDDLRSMNNTYFIGDSKKYAGVFKSDKLMNIYMLFNNSGKVVKSGSVMSGYENGPKIDMMRLFLNDTFDIFRTLITDKNLFAIDVFNDIKNICLSKPKKYYVFSYFVSICEGCTSGWILHLLDDFAKRQNEIGVLCILNRKNTQKDLSILRSQTRVELPIILANSEFNAKWNELISKYRESDLTNIIIVIDERGTIKKAYYESCGCYGQISDYLARISGGRG